MADHLEFTVDRNANPASDEVRAQILANPGFGKFHTTSRAARTVANPQDRSKTVKVPASTAPKFTPSSMLKAELNPKKKK